LGDSIQDASFRNAVFDAMIDHMKSTKTYPTGLTSSAFKNLPHASPMRKLLIDMSKSLMTKLTSVHEKHTQIKADDLSWEVDPCQYHVHTNDDDKTKCNKTAL
jgi:hypothetical protein